MLLRWRKRCFFQAFLDDREISIIKRAPKEVRTSQKVETDRPLLLVTDSSGIRYSYEIGIVQSLRDHWLHFSFRVSKSFGAEIDCLISKNKNVSDGAFKRGEIDGIRFQPFIMPEAKNAGRDLTGRGLIARGLHYPGWITPANLSFLCICDKCRESFAIRSVHAGFSELIYLYCNACPNVMLVKQASDGAPVLRSMPAPETCEKFEQTLPECNRCGGRFAYYNPFRCRHCNAPYIDFRKYPQERGIVYYASIEVGEEPQAP